MPPQQRYHLKITNLQAELLLVESFILHEPPGRPFAADIRISSARQDIDLVSLLDHYPRISIHGSPPDVALFPDTPPQLLCRWRGSATPAISAPAATKRRMNCALNPSSPAWAKAATPVSSCTECAGDHRGRAAPPQRPRPRNQLAAAARPTDGSGKTETIKSSYAKSQLKIVFEPLGE